MKITGDLEAETLRILRALPGVKTEIGPSPQAGADAVLRAAGITTPLLIEVKRRVNAASARLILEQTKRNSSGLPVLVVAGETTAEAREILSTAEVGVVDSDGNAHVELPGVVIHVDGRPTATHRRTPARLSGKAGVIAQTLLAQRERSWKVTDLANEAQVSVGLAHRVLARLEGEGVVRAEGAGPGRTRHVENPAALLDLWAEEQRDRPLRSRAFLLAQTTRQTMDALDAGLQTAAIDHALTGPAGASLLAPFVTAVQVVEVWAAATAAPERLCGAVGAELVDAGHNLIFLQAKDDTPLLLRQRVEGRWVANPFRLYVDLLHAPQRGREQAEHLRAEVIGF